MPLQYVPEKSVLLIGNHLSSSRASRSPSEDLREHLALLGWAVRTASNKTGRVSRLLDMLWTAWKHRRSYRVAHVDVFSGRAFLWAEAVCWILRRAGKPYVVTLHGGALPHFARRWPGRVRRLLASAAAVTVPSSYLLDQMRGYADDVRPVPNPVDLGRYAFRLREQPMPQLIWLRAFHAMYNPMLAPRVVALLAPQFSQVLLTMVGPDKGDGIRSKTEDVAKRVGSNCRIKFVNGVPKTAVPAALDAADIFVNTTDVDNTPVSVLEAMACGLCVVSTNVGGIPYLLDHEKDALLVAPNDAEAMAAAVGRILTEPGLGARLSKNARRKAEQFDWSIVLPQWEKLLIEVAERGRP